MGDKRHTYIGPFAKVKLPLIKHEEKKTYASCSDPSCPEHKVRVTGKFCMHCGAEIRESEKLIITNRTLDIRDFTHDLDMDACRGINVNYDYFGVYYGNAVEGLGRDEAIIIPNHDVPDLPDMNDEGAMVSLLRIHPEIYLDRFKNHHREVLWELEHVVGLDNISYDYGIFYYWS